MSRPSDCRIAALGALALAASHAGAQLPSYVIETRFVLAAPFAPGATRVQLSLQARAIYDGAFPIEIPGSGYSYGNFGVFSMGFGPNGAAQPSTISLGGEYAWSVSLNRGTWGPYHVIPSEGAPYDWFPRGAAPGIQQSEGSSLFRRGFRFFNNNSAAIDNVTGNGLFPGDAANGEFTAAGTLTNFNLLRDDFLRPDRQLREASSLNPSWMDIYRVDVIDPRGMMIGDSPFNAYAITFDGWLRAAGQSSRVGSNWVLTGGPSFHSTTSFGFYLLPSPGAAVVLVLGATPMARRRR